MKLLRQTIRQLIKESACDSANNKIKGAINILERDGLEVVLNNPIHWFKKNMSYRMEIHIYPKGGAFEADPTGDGATAVYLAERADGECLDAFITEWTNVAEPYRNKGLGALIYDIAVELSAKSGITSDRSEVSRHAFKNWKYLKKTRDTKKKPLDNQWNTYTPNTDWDNCGDTSWQNFESDIPYDHSDWPPQPKWDEIHIDTFQEHPLNNVYVKVDSSMPTVKCLEEKGLIRWVR